MFIALDESLSSFFPSPSSSASVHFFICSLISSAHLCVFGASFLNDDYKDRGGIRAVVLGEANRRVGRNRKERADEGEPRDLGATAAIKQD